MKENRVLEKTTKKMTDQTISTKDATMLKKIDNHQGNISINIIVAKDPPIRTWLDVLNELYKIFFHK
ncbi:MAG: hypothetical protein AABY87_12970 [bacterium]